ncbi:hypothetical protein BDV98DRAFT_554505 [Pterulicium gracile]|uniref:Uncharacterized protein n=1 Tax=Pterulicium gracile TaxID=1884261 RepID=A0A5C3Q4Q6_9AGAR|nr:hypothetical protein BDV98DRAFT_554505 [Pterula gracilis]
MSPLLFSANSATFPAPANSPHPPSLHSFLDFPASRIFFHEPCQANLLHIGRHSRIWTERLEGWQSLYREVFGQDSPYPVRLSSVARCVLKEVNVNIVDLVDARRTGKRVNRFPSREALRKYSRKHKKIFSLQRAKDNGILTVLLIDMFGHSSSSHASLRAVGRQHLESSSSILARTSHHRSPFSRKALR